MIQASEIKVGNMFTRELRNSRGMEYDHDFVLDEKAMGELFSDNNSLALQDLFGIPLTPDVLLKCGFKQQLDNKNLLFLNEFRYNFNEKSITLLRSCDKAGESQRHACGYPFITDYIMCRYLHQLQNLYYSLTQTELPIEGLI